jgi:hypothetical protein
VNHSEWLFKVHTTLTRYREAIIALDGMLTMINQLDERERIAWENDIEEQKILLKAALEWELGMRVFPDLNDRRQK